MADILWDAYEWRGAGEGIGVMDADERIRGMEQAIERLMATNAAMWGLLRQRTGLTDYDLLVRLRQEEVGRQSASAKAAHHDAVKCARCGRTVPGKRGRCIYCGEERPR